MSQASRSLSKPLLLAAFLLPTVAFASGQLELSPPNPSPATKAPMSALPASSPKVKPAVTAAAPSIALAVSEVKAAAPDPTHKAPAKAESAKRSEVKHAHVIYAHPLRRRDLRLHRAWPRHERHAHEKMRARPKTRARPKLPTGSVVVSTQGLNRFVFPAAIDKGPIFPADAPVLGAPVYLDGNQQVLVQFVPGADTPFEMIVELAGHQVESYLLVPRNVPGVTFHARGAHPPRKSWSADPVGEKQGSAHQAEITLLRSVVMGEVPDAFYPTQLPSAVRFDKFSLVPRATWSDGSGHRILIYTLVSAHGQAAVVAAPEFYHKGMTAISLSGEVVDATHSPVLYILEGANRG